MGIPGLILLGLMAVALAGFALVAVLSGVCLRLFAWRRPRLRVRRPEAVTFVALVGAGIVKLLFVWARDGGDELTLLDMATTPLVLAYLSCAGAYRLCFDHFGHEQLAPARIRWEQAASLALLPVAMFAVPLLMFFVVVGTA